MEEQEDPGAGVSARLSSRGWPAQALSDFVFHEYERRECTRKARSTRRFERHHCRLGGVAEPFYQARPLPSLSAADSRLLGAVKQGKDPQVVLELLESGASASAQEVFKARRSALHIACSRRDVATVKLLLSYGADLEARDVLGNRPVDIAMYANNETYQTIVQHMSQMEGANQLSQALSKVTMTEPGLD